MQCLPHDWAISHWNGWTLPRKSWDAAGKGVRLCVYCGVGFADTKKILQTQASETWSTPTSRLWTGNQKTHLISFRWWGAGGDQNCWTWQKRLDAAHDWRKDPKLVCENVTRTGRKLQRIVRTELERSQPKAMRQNFSFDLHWYLFTAKAYYTMISWAWLANWSASWSEWLLDKSLELGV